MSGQINIAGNDASVQLIGNDVIDKDQQFTFPNVGGQLVTKAYVDNNSGGGNNGGGDGTPGVRYQEGTWTPTSETGTIDIVADRCVWSRTGNTVTVSGNIDSFSDTSANSYINISGLPYVSESSTVGVCYSGRIATSQGQVNVAYTTENASFILFASSPTDPNTPPLVATHSDIGEGTSLRFLWWTITYQTEDITFVPGTGTIVNEDTQGIGGGGATGVRYQEGNWTPTLTAGTATFSNAVWTRTGNTVTFSCFAENFTDTTNSIMNFLGLPYYPVGLAATGPFNAAYVSKSASGSVFSSTAITNSGAIQVYATSDDVYEPLRHNNIVDADNFSCYISGTYVTNDTTFVTTGATVTTDIQGGGSDGSGTGADAWGRIATNGTLKAGQNVSITKQGTGEYEVTFTTPMPNDTYSIVQSTGGDKYTASFANVTSSGFLIKTTGTTAGNPTDMGNAFAVFASNAIAPQYGVGADAWGTTQMAGSDGPVPVTGSYNIASANRNGLGFVDFTFITPLPTDDYAVTAIVNDARSVNVGVYNRTTTGFRLAGYSIPDTNLADAGFSFVVQASSIITPTYTWTRDGTTLLPANAGDDLDGIGSITAAAGISTGSTSPPADTNIWSFNGDKSYYSQPSSADDTTGFIIREKGSGVNYEAGIVQAENGALGISVKGGTGPRTTTVKFKGDGSINGINKIVIDRGANTEDSAYYETNLNGTRTAFLTGNGSLYLGGATTTEANVTLTADGSQTWGNFNNSATDTRGCYLGVGGSNAGFSVQAVDGYSGAALSVWNGATKVFATSFAGALTCDFLVGTGYRNLNASSSGTITTGSSDARLKENVTPLESASVKIQALNPVKFQWKNREEAGDDFYVGFIAQEMEQVFPQVTYENSDGMKGINYQDLIAPLTKALQESIARIEALEAEVAALKS